MKLKLTGVELVLAIAGLVLIGGSSLTAMAFEMKNGSVSRFIANLGQREIKKIISFDNKIDQTTTISSQSTTTAVSTKTTAQSTTKKSSKKSSSNNSSSSDLSSDSSSGSNGSGSGSSDSGGSSGSTTTTSAPSSSSNIFGKYSTTSVEDIVNALDLVFDDATGDYSEPGGGGPPEGVYNYAPIDQDNVYMGVRDGRLYIKIAISGTFPTSQETISSDTIKSVTFNIHFSKSSDPESSNECGGVETSTQINIGYNNNGQIWYNPWFSANCNNTEPYQSGHDWSFEKTGDGLAHTYNSGIGKNSLVYSYALADLLGTINVGDAVKLDISSEAESNNWEHYSYDQNRSSRWVDWVVKGI